ncbi:YceD family protein [Alcaligenes sp. SDU_A2]|uniref:YceD family protein n=1 Tax=Alcaligenes sp. SDU_A2 TaxID=3136634 RepID=UPI002C70B7B8|nr:YceD family protein [Alcaligenes sp.]HRL28349.1 YceD family protein [Alcaligenes sp.]
MAKHYIDTQSLGRGPQRLAGQARVADLSRLVSDLPAQGDLVVDWSVAGRADSAGRNFVLVQAQGSVVLQCQRCMKPFEWPLDISNEVEVVATEAELELDDDDVEGPDRIFCEGRLDALGLVEDELILSVPYVPRHEVCPGNQPDAAPEDEPPAKRESPFAVLGSLKKP